MIQVLLPPFLRGVITVVFSFTLLLVQSLWHSVTTTSISRALLSKVQDMSITQPNKSLITYSARTGASNYLNPLRKAGTIKATSPSREQGIENYGTKFQPRNMNNLVASRICQATSIWSFGYGIFRYLSVRKNLLQGHFVLVIWGPFWWHAALGVLGIIIQMDWRRRTSPIRQKKNGGWEVHARDKSYGNNMTESGLFKLSI